MNEYEHWCRKCWLTKRTVETNQGWICADCLNRMAERELQDVN